MKKILIIFGFFVVVVVIAFVIGIGRGDTPVEQNSAAENIDLSLGEDGWYSIKYIEEGVSLSVPKTWNPILGKDLAKGILANHSGDFVSTTAFLNYKPDTYSFDVDRFKTDKPYFTVETEGTESRQVINYFGKGESSVFDYAGDEEEVAPSEDTYLIGKIIVSTEGFIQTECQAEGANYSEEISSCNRIVESLRFNP